MFFKKKTKIKYASSNIWRLVYLINVNTLYTNTEKKFRSRSSIIPKTFLSQKMLIYTGKVWVPKFTTKWIIGHKIGEFTWNKKPALFKVKKKKTKK